MKKRTMQLAVFAVFIGVSTLPAQAAVINVAAGEVAVANNGICSLHEAIRNAEADADTSGGDCAAGSGADTIVLATGSTYTLTAPYQQAQLGTYDNNSGLPGIRSNVTINGNGATIQRDASLFTGTACGGAGAKFRIFYVIPSGNLTLNNLALQNGCTDTSSGAGAGGAIFNQGTLSLDYVTVTNNQAMRSGGAIHNDGNLTLTRSTVSNNAVITVEAGGGGIVNRGTMLVSQSTISGNSSEGAGGGVDTGNYSYSATFANSTVSGNQSAGNGGGIFSRNNTSLFNTTIAANTGTRYLSPGPGPGSGIYNASGTVTLANSLIVQQVNGANCNGSFTDSGNNLADDATCSTATVTATPLIGALANNGGTTLTHALLNGSPAIEAGNNTICNASPVNGVDQRGVTRPQNTTCDIGAYESGEPFATLLSISGTAQVGQVLTGSYVYSDAENDPEDVSGAGTSYRFVRSTDNSVVSTGDNVDAANSTTGGTNKTYTVQAADAGKYLFYCVTPRASSGMSPGLEACSSATVQVPIPVDGVCGSAHGQSFSFTPSTNLCSVGAATAVSSANGQYTWGCQGISGGQNNSSCAANWVNAGSNNGGQGTASISTTNNWVLDTANSSGFIPTTGNAKSPPTLPAGYSFPHGLLDFTLTGGSAGSNATIVITYGTALPAGTVYWKYGPTSTNSIPHWYQMPSNQVTFSPDRKTITLTIQDNGLGDDAYTTDSVIVDQGGPGAPVVVTSIPTLSQWGIFILSSVLALGALVTLRRQRL